MPAGTLTLRQINRATLARQMLLARERTPPLRAIERLVALQAQWPRPPFLGLWSRLEGFERAHLTELFTRRTAVRATFLRATIHVVSTRDFLSMRAALQPVLDAAMQGILRDRLAGLDLEALVARARALLEERPRTFEDLRDEFLRADPGADERAIGYAVRMRLPLVQVPDAHASWAFPSQACFTPADTWLGRRVPVRPVPPDDLLLRYLAAYGPASARDFQAWSGVAPPDTRAAIERLDGRLQRFRDDQKHELFDLPDAPRPDADTPAPVRLVPEYDNVITTRADERFVARRHRPKVFLPALRIAATVLVDGFAAGTWRLQVTRRTATVTIEPFAPFASRVKKEVLAETEALARFAEPDARAVEVRVV